MGDTSSFLRCLAPLLAAEGAWARLDQELAASGLGDIYDAHARVAEACHSARLEGRMIGARELRVGLLDPVMAERDEATKLAHDIHRALATSTRDTHLPGPGDVVAIARRASLLSRGRFDLLHGDELVPSRVMEGFADWRRDCENRIGQPPGMSVALAWRSLLASRVPDEPMLRDTMPRVCRILLPRLCRAFGATRFAPLYLSEGLTGVEPSHRPIAGQSADEWLAGYGAVAALAAERGMERLRRIKQVRDRMVSRCPPMRRTSRMPDVVQAVLELGVFRVRDLEKSVGMTSTGARQAVERLECHGLLHEMTGRRTYRVYAVDVVTEEWS